MLPSLSSDPARLRAQLSAQLEAASWRFASTMRFIPHWYSMNTTWASPEAFAWCCAAIQQLGTPRVWKRREFVYFDDVCPTCGCGWTYWLMEAPASSTLINKARITAKETK